MVHIRYQSLIHRKIMIKSRKCLPMSKTCGVWTNWVLGRWTYRRATRTTCSSLRLYTHATFSPGTQTQRCNTRKRSPKSSSKVLWKSIEHCSNEREVFALFNSTGKAAFTLPLIEYALRKVCHQLQGHSSTHVKDAICAAPEVREMLKTVRQCLGHTRKDGPTSAQMYASILQSAFVLGYPDEPLVQELGTRVSVFQQQLSIGTMSRLLQRAMSYESMIPFVSASLPQFIDRLADPSTGISGPQYLPATLFRMLALPNHYELRSLRRGNSSKHSPDKFFAELPALFEQGLQTLKDHQKEGHLSGWMVRPAFDRFTDIFNENDGLRFEESLGRKAYEFLSVISQSLSASFRDYREPVDPKMFTTVAFSFTRISDFLDSAKRNGMSLYASDIGSTVRQMDETILAARNRLSATSHRWVHLSRYADNEDVSKHLTPGSRYQAAEMSRKYAMYLANVTNAIFTPETVDKSAQTPRGSSLRLAIASALSECYWFNGPHSSWIPWVDAKNASAICDAITLLTDRRQRTTALYEICLAWPSQTQLRSPNILLKLRVANSLSTLAVKSLEGSPSSGYLAQQRDSAFCTYAGGVVTDDFVGKATEERRKLDIGLSGCYVDNRFIPVTDIPNIQNTWDADGIRPVVKEYLYGFQGTINMTVHRFLAALLKQIAASPPGELRKRVSANVLAETLDGLGGLYKDLSNALCENAPWVSSMHRVGRHAAVLASIVVHKLSAAFVQGKKGNLWAYSVSVTPDELCRLVDAVRANGLVDSPVVDLIRTLTVWKHHQLDMNETLSGIQAGSDVSHRWRLPHVRTYDSEFSSLSSDSVRDSGMRMRSHKITWYQTGEQLFQQQQDQLHKLPTPGSLVQGRPSKLSHYFTALSNTAPAVPASVKQTISLDPDTMGSQSSNAPADEIVSAGSNVRDAIDGSGNAALHRNRNIHLESLALSAESSSLLCRQTPRIASHLEACVAPSCCWLWLERDPFTARNASDVPISRDEVTLERAARQACEWLGGMASSTEPSVGDDAEPPTEHSALCTLSRIVKAHLESQHAKYGVLFFSSLAACASRIVENVGTDVGDSCGIASFLRSVLVPGVEVRNMYTGTTSLGVTAPISSPWEQFEYRKNGYILSTLQRATRDNSLPYWIDTIEIKRLIGRGASPTEDNLRSALSKGIEERVGRYVDTAEQLKHGKQAMYIHQDLLHPFVINQGTVSTKPERPKQLREVEPLPSWASSSAKSLHSSTAEEEYTDFSDFDFEKLQKSVYKTPRLPRYCSPFEDGLLDSRLALVFEQFLKRRGTSIQTECTNKELDDYVRIGSTFGNTQSEFSSLFQKWGHQSKERVDKSPFSDLVWLAKVATSYTPVVYEENWSTSTVNHNPHFDCRNPKPSAGYTPNELVPRAMVDVASQVLESVSSAVIARGFVDGGAPLDPSKVVSMLFHLAQGYRSSHQVESLKNTHVPELCDMALRWLFAEEVVSLYRDDNQLLQQTASLIEEIKAVCTGAETPMAMRKEYASKLQKDIKQASDARLRTSDSNFYRRLALNTVPVEQQRSNSSSSQYKDSYGF
eukprot:gb/GECG01009319.1/.p1 GENE.gb/GECG01009319.1/~~gb/GECG01009319.1/.p1  ORF type:complete len:1554 (+),score=164.54 gb/GECG01009319.1/:1-4662(+)